MTLSSWLWWVLSYSFFLAAICGGRLVVFAILRYCSFGSDTPKRNSNPRRRAAFLLGVFMIAGMSGLSLHMSYYVAETEGSPPSHSINSSQLLQGGTVKPKSIATSEWSSNDIVAWMTQEGFEGHAGKLSLIAYDETSLFQLGGGDLLDIGTSSSSEGDLHSTLQISRLSYTVFHRASCRFAHRAHPRVVRVLSLSLPCLHAFILSMVMLGYRCVFFPIWRELSCPGVALVVRALAGPHHGGHHGGAGAATQE